MLIRKSLYGNLRPNPGDLYDPRDGTCLPNFHLSTNHNPNLPHIKQDLVKYDIQLVREMPTTGSFSNSSNNNAVTERVVDAHSLMLLAVAEYSETLGVKKGSVNWPFVIHKVFYREAVAGIIHLRHRAGDKDIAMLQSSLRKFIPNPSLEGKQVLEQYKMAVSKVSIIQHGQEYHYTNIFIAFTEIRKIINQVCSPSNFNARSVLVEIPQVLPYHILDKNKYLAYLYEKQRIERENEEELRRQELRKQYKMLTHQQMEERILLERQMRMEHESSSSITHHYTHNFFHDSANSHNEINRNEIQMKQIRGKFIKFPIETSLRTIKGNKVITYHDTGETVVYDYHGEDNEMHNTRETTDQIDTYQESNLSSSKNFSKSTPNLNDDQTMSGGVNNFNSSASHNLVSKSRENSLHNNFSAMTESYLRRSRSQDNLEAKDIIYRYPSLLIEPGRKQIKRDDFANDWVDKWRQKAPKYWGTNETKRPVSVLETRTSSSASNKNIEPQLTRGNLQSDKNAPSNSYYQEKYVPAFRGSSNPHMDLISTNSRPHFNQELHKSKTDMNNFVHVPSQNSTGRYSDSETSSFQHGHSRDSSQDLGHDTLDRDFVYRAYPVSVRQLD